MEITKKSFHIEFSLLFGIKEKLTRPNEKKYDKNVNWISINFIFSIFKNTFLYYSFEFVPSNDRKEQALVLLSHVINAQIEFTTLQVSFIIWLILPEF